MTHRETQKMIRLANERGGTVQNIKTGKPKEKKKTDQKILIDVKFPRNFGRVVKVRDGKIVWTRKKEAL